MQQSVITKRIVHILWDFKFSGAHAFAVNLANEQAKNYQVTLVNINPRVSDTNLISRIAPNVQVINLGLSRIIRSITYRIGHFFTGMMQNSLLYADLLAFKLTRLLKQADIVHTHFVKERFIVSKALEMIGQNAPKHIMTDHGGFLNVESQAEKNGKSYKQYNKAILQHIIKYCSCIVTISDPQNLFWRKKQLEGLPVKFYKIYNGTSFVLKQPKSREELGYRKDDFIFVMVARGSEPTKGWELSINAFLQHNDPTAKLLLIGGGKEIDRLQAIYGSNQNIKFTGMVQNPADYLHVADVGVLPSTYAAESLPTSIIEYLKAGKPVIASDIGDIKYMLQIGKNEAGILLPIVQKQIDVNVYATAMHTMQYNNDRYSYFKENALEAAKQYDIEYCAYRYATEIYQFEAPQSQQHKKAS